MNPRTTGILFLIAAALGAFVYFYEIRGEEGRREAEARQKRLFPDVEAEAVEWLALTSSDGKPVRAERREKGWQIVEPLVFPGDEFALDGTHGARAEGTCDAQPGVGKTGRKDDRHAAQEPQAPGSGSTGWEDGPAVSCAGPRLGLTGLGGRSASWSL